MARMTAAEAAVRVLEREGIDVCFGVPGAAIAGAGREHDLFHLSFEGARDLGTDAFALELRRGGEPVRRLAIGHGHAEWLSDSGAGRPYVR